MQRKARIFRNGRSQAVRLPVEPRFPGTEAFFEEPNPGSVMLSSRPDPSWKSFFVLRDQAAVPDDFMNDREDERAQTRNLF